MLHNQQVSGESWEYKVLQDTLEAIVLHTAGSAGHDNHPYAVLAPGPIDTSIFSTQ